MKTAKTQPYPVGDSFVPTCPEPDSVPPGMKEACVFGAYWDAPVVIAPGTLGGISWAPMSFSPRTGRVTSPARSQTRSSRSEADSSARPTSRALAP